MMMSNKQVRKISMFLLLVIFMLALASGAMAQGVKFSFAVISDTHNYGNCNAEQGKWLEDVVEVINSKSPAFVVGVGDMVAGGGDCKKDYSGKGGNDGAEKQWVEFSNKFLDRLDVPFVPVKGNHDVYDSSALTQDKQYSHKVWNSFWASNSHNLLNGANPEQGGYRFEYQGVGFSAINYYDTYKLKQEESNWIGQNVQSGDVVFRHVNLYTVACEKVGDCNSGISVNGEKLAESLKQKGVKALFSGHTHAFYDGVCNGLRFINTGSLGKRSMEYVKGWENSPYKKKQAFVWVDVLDNGELKISFYVWNGNEFVLFDNSNFPISVKANVGKTGSEVTCASVGGMGATDTPVVPSVVDVPPSIGGTTILHIGDSHTAGTYGKELESQLKLAGHEVKTYGCVSATAEDYVEGGRSCTSGSTFEGEVMGYSLPSINNLLDQFDPDVVIISLGANYLESGDLRDQSIGLAGMLGGRACYWVGPPNDPGEEVWNFYNEFSGLVVGNCNLVDSRKYTEFDFCSEVGESSCSADVHFDSYGEEGKKVARAWAKSVFNDLSLSGSGAKVSDFRTMLVLGSHKLQTLKDRINGAYDLIGEGDFEKVIVSGGCAYEGESTYTCPSCAGGCTEAGKMKELLLDRGIEEEIIVVEDKSKSTKSNYQNSKGLIGSGKVVVVSDHKHAKAVSYCLRYVDGKDAYYYVVGESSGPEIIPTNPPVSDDYGDMIASCKTKVPKGVIPGQPDATDEPEKVIVGYKKVEKEILGCKSRLACQQIDEIWQKVGPKVGQSGIWSPEDGNFMEFDDYYYDKIPDYGPAPKPGPSPWPEPDEGPAPKPDKGGNQWNGLISQAATAQGAEAAFVKAIMKAESGFKPDTVSGTNYVGLMQIRATGPNDFGIDVQCSQKKKQAKKLCDTSKSRLKGTYLYPTCSSGGGSACKSDDRFKPKENIEFGTSHLLSKIKSMGFDKNSLTACKRKAVVAAYNIGQGVVRPAVEAVGCSSWKAVWDYMNNNIIFYSDGRCNVRKFAPELSTSYESKCYKHNDKCDCRHKLDNLRDDQPSYLKKIYTAYQSYSDYGLGSE